MELRATPRTAREAAKLRPEHDGLVMLGVSCRVDRGYRRRRLGFGNDLFDQVPVKSPRFASKDVPDHTYCDHLHVTKGAAEEPGRSSARRGIAEHWNYVSLRG